MRIDIQTKADVVDLLRMPEAFRVVDNRITLGLAHIKEMAEQSGRTLVW